MYALHCAVTLYFWCMYGQGRQALHFEFDLHLPFASLNNFAVYFTIKSTWT